jgi:hypothetical protein
MTNVIPKPDDWAVSLDKIVHFERGKELAKFKLGYIYRPFKNIHNLLTLLNATYNDMDVDEISTTVLIKKWLAQKYPDGECSEFKDREPNYENYKILYNWINNCCVNCSNSCIVWDTYESVIQQYCRYCGMKKVF